MWKQEILTENGQFKMNYSVVSFIVFIIVGPVGFYRFYVVPYIQIVNYFFNYEKVLGAYGPPPSRSCGGLGGSSDPPRALCTPQTDR